MSPSEQLLQDYETLKSGKGFVVLDDHFLIELTGTDRQTFLHNFCTADIKGLEAGQSCEAFILNTKGKILSFVNVLALENSLWLVAANRKDAETVVQHLDMYLIRDDVQLRDLSAEKKLYSLPNSPAVKSLLQPSETDADCWKAELGQAQGVVAKFEIAGTGILVVIDMSAAEDFETWLQQHELCACLTTALEPIRIEKQTPWSGSEANPDHLPQELQRDERAISFDKGCYLGQETVARLDSLGRVNQLLVGFDFGDFEPAAGSDLFADEKKSGRVTSVAWSPSSNSWIGLGYARRAFAKSGSELLVNGKPVRVVALM